MTSIFAMGNVVCNPRFYLYTEVQFSDGLGFFFRLGKGIDGIFANPNHLRRFRNRKAVEGIKIWPQQ